MPELRTATLEHAVIHAPEPTTPPVTFAAEELQRYLHRLTGTRVPIVSDEALRNRAALVMTQAGTLAPLQTPPPDPGDFASIPEPGGITLTAGSPRALLDAVYAFLEQLGCRWSLHGPQDETVPRLTTSAIELRPITRSPRFRVRGYCSDIMTWHYTQPEHFHDRLVDDRAFIDWMGKSGANAFFYIRHPFDTQLTIPELLPEFQKRAIDVEYGGHVMPLLLPRDLYREHPEYFPQAPDGQRTDHGNLCTSNAAALAAAGASAVQYVRDYPEMSALHIWGADLWHGGWCRCSACAPISVQDQNLRVCNAVARGLAEAGVARPVCYLAYHDTIDPDVSLHPDPNVVAEFAPRERCYGHALNDPACHTNRRYAAALEGYVDRFDGRVRLFEYYGDAILFFGCTVPLAEVIAADLEYFQRLGIPDILMLQFGTFSRWAYPLNFETFATLAAGHASAAPAVEAYCARFGAHARTARALFAEVEAIMRPVVTYGDIRRPPRSPEDAARVLAQIEAAVPRLAAVVQRLEQLGDVALAAYGTLVRYTQTVLDGVRLVLRQTPDAEARYGEALRIIEGVERRFKGLWGTVDLPIIHSFYTAAAHPE